MEHEKSHLADVTEKAKDYLNTQLELGQLKALEFGALSFSALLGKLILLLICFCFLMFASLALAVYISVSYRNPWLGYLIVALLYFILFLVVYFNRKKLLDSPLANIFIRSFTKRE
jgi:hypothetical protein